MAKRGRLFLLASWLVVRLHWTMQATLATLQAPRRQGRFSIANNTALINERWFLAEATPGLIVWSQNDQAFQLRCLPELSVN
jgi:hypothetical protein